VTDDQVAFRTVATLLVPDRALHAVELSPPTEPSAHVELRDEGIVFRTEGWYEVLLRVDWDATNTTGTRFSHTKIPGQEPLHSEAIDAGVLAQISDGRQLLRGNSLFGPDRTTSLVLEVWQDSGTTVGIAYAELVVRELAVPFERR
jgi:hypothetical protein